MLSSLKLFSTIIILFSSCFVSCQRSGRTYLEPVDPKFNHLLFQRYFNDKKNDSILSLFSESVDDKIKAKSIIHLSIIREKFGSIKYMLPILKSEVKFAFETEVEKGIFDTKFELDANGQLINLTFNELKTSSYGYFERNLTEFILPFEDQWYIFRGGSTMAQNSHNRHPNLFGAYDFWIMGENDKSHRTDGKLNHDYYAFGKKIIAPCDAKVVRVISGIEDNTQPPNYNLKDPTGNLVILKTSKNEYLLFAHLKYESITVKEREFVIKGQEIGRCGNSGYSTEPHLHFLLQNSPNFIATQGSISFFKEIMVNGILKKDYSPVKGEKVKNKKL